jgi:hypothetical protein
VHYLPRAQLWSPQHDLRGCFDLYWNCSFARWDSDRASLDPKALSAQRPEHYIAAGIILMVSAGIGLVVASQIVVALGYTPW